MALDTVDTTLGAIEIGCLFSVFLFGVLCTQAYAYSESFKQTSYFTNGAVILVWCLDLGQTICVAHTTYTATITWLANPRSVDELINVRSMPLAILFSILAEFAVRVVFIERIRAFSGGRVVVALCYTASGLTLIGGIMIFAAAWASTTLSSLLLKWDWLLTATFSGIVVADCLIAATLSYYLKQSARWLERTSKIVDKLMLWTIETGLLTSCAALALLVCFQTMRQNYIHVSIYTVLPKLITVYSNALLALLNGRTTLRNISDYDSSINVHGLEFTSTRNPTSGTSMPDRSFSSFKFNVTV
ncbi:hypothetical protein BDZ94DRAFT_1253373 [Collybia nuda]|uniref:DUF6534 domain-containing protein n=1 Tax=Collybia nuda TaxID=64659 RepID=A0A9P5YA76_9AGAR|nr:hypothetical protein BDZ94DRAFT_1253373 [Collybia nuda]